MDSLGINEVALEAQMFRLLPSLAFLIAALAAYSHSATAATVIGADVEVVEEMVVTAEFRSTDISDLAGSASVIRPNEDGTTVQHLEEVLARAPNVNFASGASRGRFIQIRGIGERGQFPEPLIPSVALVVDGVDLSGIGGAATLFDVAQVEVLRGPQGTLYGANALAGLINIVTKDPTDEMTASLRLDAGEYDTLGLGAVVSGPLSDQLGYRVSVQQYEDDGFVENDFLGRDDTNNRDEASYRAKLVWQGDSASARLTLGRVDIDNGYDAFSLDNDRTTFSDEPGQDVQETDYAALNVSVDLSDQINLSGAYGFAATETDYGYDEDWAFVGFHPSGYSSTDRYIRERDTQTLDLRLSSSLAETGGWDWLAGIYLYDQQVDLERQYFSPFESTYEVSRLAVYGELSRSFADAWQVTLGARYERHEAEYDDSNASSFDPNDDLFGGRLLVERTLNSGALVYAGITQGYKSGGFNPDGRLSGSLRQFDPEELWNVEFGYKTKFVNERLDLRAAVFRMQRSDIQIRQSVIVPVPNSSAVEFVPYTVNAAEGFNQGVELELNFAATDNLSFFANIGLLDSEYEDYVDDNGVDQDGREQAHAPSYQFFAGAQLRVAEGWTARVELEGKDEFFFSDSHPQQSDAYELLNASIGYRSQRWSATLWGRNLTDEDYFVRGYFWGNDPRTDYEPTLWTQLGEPSRYGLTVQVNW